MSIQFVLAGTFTGSDQRIRVGNQMLARIAQSLFRQDANLLLEKMLELFKITLNGCRHCARGYHEEPPKHDSQVRSSRARLLSIPPMFAGLVPSAHSIFAAAPHPMLQYVI